MKKAAERHTGNKPKVPGPSYAEETMRRKGYVYLKIGGPGVVWDCLGEHR